MRGEGGMERDLTSLLTSSPMVRRDYTGTPLLGRGHDDELGTVSSTHKQSRRKVGTGMGVSLFMGEDLVKRIWVLGS